VRRIAAQHFRGGGIGNQRASGGEREARHGAAGGGDEAVEQGGLARVVREQFGVPLDAEAEAGGGVRQRLDGAVRRAGADLEPCADGIGALVVEAVDRQLGRAGDAVQQRPG
jgi:hypothetical protein